jgi:hypothetical protein
MNKTSKLVALSHIETLVAELSNEMMDNEEWQDAMFKTIKGLVHAKIVLEENLD